MPHADDPPRGTWRNYLGPVVLTPHRRRFNTALLAVWVAASMAALATERYGIVWLPLIGTATSSALLLRDRAGRRRSR